MRNTKLLTALSLITLGAGVANADAPKLSEVLDASGITATGYVDAMYQYSSGLATYHQFDTHHDSLSLNQAGLTLAYQPKEGFGALVNVIAGDDAQAINLAQSSGTNSGSFNLTQAYVQWAGSGWTVIGGKYVTLAGAEVIAPTGNVNSSRSLLFFAEPLTHTGLRATYAATDTVSVVFGVNNGWNYNSNSKSAKTGEIGVSFAPSKAFVLAAQGYFGKDPTFNATREFVDLVATYNATDSLSFVLNYDWGKQKDAFGAGADGKWQGAAGYVNYAINDAWRVSVRLEYLKDSDGFMFGIPNQKLKEGTVTFGYSPVKSFELRLEGRYDKSDQDAFVKTDGTTVKDSQTGATLEGLYKF
jgi:hypothetical protein